MQYIGTELFVQSIFWALLMLWWIYMPLVLICVENNWAGSWFTMAVLGCRLLVLVIQPSIKKDKNCGWDFVMNDCNYDENVMKMWWNYDSLIHSETKWSAIIN